MYIYENISLNSSYIEKFLSKTCRENQNTHFIFNVTFIFENPAICEIMCKNLLQTDRPQTTI